MHHSLFYPIHRHVLGQILELQKRQREHGSTSSGGKDTMRRKYEVKEIPFLGGGEMGLYVCKLGGLPLASTGYLERSLSNLEVSALLKQLL